jgi:hypothetical protein
VIRLSQLLGQPAVDLASAERVGTVVAVAVRDGRITAVDVEAEVVAAAAVRTFEGDTVTFGAHEALDRDAVPGLGRIIGWRTLDGAGDGLGAIVDLDLDDRGLLETVELPGRTVPGRWLRSVGSYAAMIIESSPPLPPPAPR